MLALQSGGPPQARQQHDHWPLEPLHPHQQRWAHILGSGSASWTCTWSEACMLEAAAGHGRMPATPQELDFLRAAGAITALANRSALISVDIAIRACSKAGAAGPLLAALARVAELQPHTPSLPQATPLPVPSIGMACLPPHCLVRLHAQVLRSMLSVRLLCRWACPVHREPAIPAHHPATCPSTCQKHDAAVPASPASGAAGGAALCSTAAASAAAGAGGSAAHQSWRQPAWRARRLAGCWGAAAAAAGGTAFGGR